jgi:ABC-2 type transport system permease protein
MRRVWPVARREYLERVRSKAFVIGTFVGPVLMAALMIGPAIIASKQHGKALRVSVVDGSGGSLCEAVESRLAATHDQGQSRFVVKPAFEGTVDDQKESARKAVLDGRLDGFVFLPKDALATSKAEYYGKNVSNRFDVRLLDRGIEEVLVSRRLESAGLDPDRIKALTQHLDLKTIRVSESGERVDEGMTFLFSTVLMMMLYVTTIMWGQALITGVIEEKTNRIVELAVSAMSPTELLSGKLLGVGAAGLTQFAVWVVAMLLISVYGGSMIAAGDSPLPEITPLILISFVVFFLLGYFLYAALYAAIGAAVNTVQEAQSLVFPVLMPLIASLMFFPVVLQSPDSPLSVGLSLFPFATPLLMFLRITALTPPMWQILLSVALTLATIALVTWASARIYRVGILMYGKRPTFPELLRWVRHS